MKNMILGMIGGVILVYTSMNLLGIYRVFGREQELALCLSEVLPHILETYYTGNDEYYPADWARPGGSAEQAVEQAIRHRMQEEGECRISIPVCDMEKGILSVYVEENVKLPGGAVRKISGKKVIIVDRETDIP